MGRPRKRRREGVGDTALIDGLDALGGSAVSVIDSGSFDLDFTTLSENEPGHGADGFPFLDSGFQRHDLFSTEPRSNKGSSNIENSRLDLSGSLASDLDCGFPSWNLSQDLDHTFTTFVDAPLQSPSPPDALGHSDGNNHTSGNAGTHCSCLSGLYSMLAKFQSLPEPSFPYTMGALRNAAALSRSVVACHECSQTYNTAIQNSMLLGTLLQLLVTEYAKLLKHIDERSEQNEKIAFRFGDPSSPFDSRHTGLPDCPMGITIDLSGDEWRTLARKAVAQEVLGNSDSSSGLIGTVQKLSERQVLWHDRYSKGSYTASHCANPPHNTENPNHTCVQVLFTENLRRSLEALGL